MAGTTDLVLLDAVARPGESARPLRRVRARQRPPVVSIAILTVLVGASVLAPFLAPESPLKINLAQAGQPPFYAHGGSLHHILGTDSLGRDILSRILYGGRITLVLVSVVLLAGASVGSVVGLGSAYAGGATDAIVQRLVEAILSLPTIMVALVFAFLMGQSYTTVVVVLSPFIAARFARMVRGDVLTIRDSSYVDLARVSGASSLRIIRKHILPNVIGTVIVVGTLELGQLILLESSLSFLGVGVAPPNPEWGLMLSQGQQYVATQYWMSLFPGLAIVLVVLAINLSGDWLRDRLDPKRASR